MKTNCDIIKDLLPLYHEGLASEASAALIKEHLPDCPACREELDRLFEETPKNTGAALPLLGIARQIKKRRWLSVALAVCLVAALGLSLFSYLTRWHAVSYEPGDLLVSRQGDQLIIDVKQDDVEVMVYGQPAYERPEVMVYAVTASTRRINDWGLFSAGKKPSQDFKVWAQTNSGEEGYFPNRLIVDLEPNEKIAVYYEKNNEPVVHLYGEDLLGEGGMVVLPRLAMAYYLVLALGLLAVLLVAAFVFRKREKVLTKLLYLLGLPVSYLIGHLLIMGFTTVSLDDFLYDFTWVLLVAALLYTAWAIAVYLMKQRHLPKGAAIA